MKTLGAPFRIEGEVYTAAFSSSGTSIVTAGADSARAWDAQSGRAVSGPMRHERVVNSAVFSPDGARVVTASADGTARIWEAKSGETTSTSLQHKSWVNSAAFSPDATHVVTASTDGAVRIWDAKSGLEINLFEHHAPSWQQIASSFGRDGIIQWRAAGAVSAAFSADGKRVVSASTDRTARIWDIQSGQVIAPHLTHDGVVFSAIFSIDGTRVVTASADGTARMWNAHSGELIASLRHKGPVFSADFSPDGVRIVTASLDKTARIWDGNSGYSLGNPLNHQSAVASAKFSPDGARVVTASRDGTARIWDVQTAEMLGAPVTPDDLIALYRRRVADNGQLEWLSGPEWMVLIDKVKAQAEQGTTKKDQLMRWHFADPATRTISPFSQITVPQHIEREIDWVLEHPQTKNPDSPNYSPQILDDAYNLDPGHPLILLALSVFEDRPETKALWKRLSFPRFEKDPRLAARAAEILLIDKDPDNARKAAELALNLPTATEADKAKAQAVLTQINAKP